MKDILLTSIKKNQQSSIGSKDSLYESSTFGSLLSTYNIDFVERFHN